MTMLNTSSSSVTSGNWTYQDYSDSRSYVDYIDNMSNVDYFNNDFRNNGFEIVLALTTLFCIFGLVGNGCVIWLLIFHIKRNPFTTYIMNLAIADFATIFIAPITIYIEFNYKFIYSFLFFPYNAGLYLLTIISIERCVSVVFPVWYRCHRPYYSSALVSGLLWVLASLLSAMNILISIFKLPWDSLIFTMHILIFILNVFIFTPVMVISTLTLLIKVCCNSWSRRPARVYTAILITLLFFIIFAIPLSILNLILLIDKNSPLKRIPEPVVVLFATVNSSINPIIYYLVGRNRKQPSRKSFQGALQRVFKDEPEDQEEGTSK